MRACKARALAVLRDAKTKWRICGVKSGRITVTALNHGWISIKHPGIATKTFNLSAELAEP